MVSLASLGPHKPDPAPLLLTERGDLPSSHLDTWVAEPHPPPPPHPRTVPYRPPKDNQAGRHWLFFLFKTLCKLLFVHKQANMGECKEKTKPTPVCILKTSVLPSQRCTVPRDHVGLAFLWLCTCQWQLAP